MTAPRLELARRAAALAVLRGWEVVRTLDSGDEELRQLVAPRGARSSAVLRLRSPVAQAQAQAQAEAEARAQAEIDALSGAPSEHVLSLIEVVAEHPRRREVKRGAPPPTLLLEHAPGGLLAELLERRPYVRAGEAATILMAVAAGVATLNERGWSHGSLTSRSVVFRDDGCPAIASLSNALPLTVQSAQSERRGFLRLAERLASSMGRDDGDRMLEAIREPLQSGGWQEVADALAVAAEPEAVFVPAGDSSELGVAAVRASRSASDPAPGSEHAASETGVLGTLLEGDPVAELVVRGKKWLQTRRRLVWLVCAPLGIVAAVLAVVPAQTPPDGSPAAADPRSAPTVHHARPTASAGAVGRTPAPVASVSPSPTSTVDHTTGTDAIRSHDPVIAAPALLSARHACFVANGAPPSCLDASTQPDAALHREDRAALGAPGAAARRDFGGAAFELVQQWGDAALVTATPAKGVQAKSEPASILLVRSEAGWRLRDVYVD
ncbi:hypothetical protein [Leifsonia sp. NPDC058248]|uniref:hypothetical protein n=1 Tax=Leifsonia sp. NPDC058248 TaxID=3346402 RepID=UPI0036DEB5D8